MTDKPKKRKSKDEKTTSDDILASLFNDLGKNAGQVDDLAQLINNGGKSKKSSKEHKVKEEFDSDKKERKVKEEFDSEKKSESKIKKPKKEKKKKRSKDESKSSKKVKSEGKSSKKVKSEDKVAKKKSKRLGSPAPSSSKQKSPKRRVSRSPAKRKRSSSPPAKRRVSRSPAKRKRSSSPPAKRRVSRSPVKRKRSSSPSRKEHRRSYTPPMYRNKWDNLRSKFDWGNRHSRDNGGKLPWEQERWSRERSRSWSPTRYQTRRRSTSPKPRTLDERRVDKRELLALARKNATRLAMEGRLPKGIELGATLKNKSVRELIELCEEIQSRDLELADPENVVVNKDDDYETTDFSTAPVRSSSIKINLKDGSSHAPKSNLERMIEENALRKHFPVSFGDNHKDKTDKMTKEWVPVELETPAEEETVVSTLSKKTVKIPTAYSAYKLPEEPVRPKREEELKMQEPMPFQFPLVQPAPEMPMSMFQLPMFPPFESMYNTGYEAPEIIAAAFCAPPPPPPPSFSSFDNPAVTLEQVFVPEPAPLTVVSNDDFIAQAEEAVREKEAEEILMSAIKDESVQENERMDDEPEMEADRSPRDEGIASPTPPPPEYTLPEGAVLERPVAPTSIGGLVSRRARLVLELNNDPNNHQKRIEIADIDIKLSLWAKTKNETTAHFGASSYMYSSVEPRPIINSVWATKDTLRLAPEFKGGIGEHLLKKMGWNPGQGLGRNMDGGVEPLTLDVKSDRKGLYSTKDKHPPRREHASVLSGNKNPVSVIMEYCAKQGIPPPLFMTTEDGTSNNRRFGCTAVLNGIEYDAATGATNKKAAKSQVCLIMCQSLGLC